MSCGVLGDEERWRGRGLSVRRYRRWSRARGRRRRGAARWRQVRMTLSNTAADRRSGVSARSPRTRASVMSGVLGYRFTTRALLPRGRSVIREELSRLVTVEERHRRLLARVAIAFESRNSRRSLCGGLRGAVPRFVNSQHFLMRPRSGGEPSTRRTPRATPCGVE